jgi:hypothetical protein
MGARHVTIQQSLQHVAANPEMPTDDLIGMPAHELISRTLFEIANGAELGNRKSMAQANIARTMIFTRLVGRRRAGSHPATRKENRIEFADLTTHKEVGQ